MVGVQKRRRINQKKGILGAGVKRKLIKRQKKIVDSSMVIEEMDNTVMNPITQLQASDITMNCEDAHCIAKNVQKPTVKKNKLRRNALPLQVSIKTAPKSNAKVNVVHARPISKKKAKKLLKAKRCVMREKECGENAMEC